MHNDGNLTEVATFNEDVNNLMQQLVFYAKRLVELQEEVKLNSPLSIDKSRNLDDVSTATTCS